MVANVDYSALNWVKKELDGTLDRAAQALEEYLEGAGDWTALQRCGGDLHQVYGTLQMVEVYGAALLAEEMELATAALGGVEGKHKEDACDVLARSILQLQDYLDKIQGGHQDIPILLLPLLNDLRATRGASLLSEAALFSPDLSRIVSATWSHSGGNEADPELRSVAKRLRHIYQLGLLGLIRDSNVAKSLQQMAAVVGELKAHSSMVPVVELWSITAGVLDALSGAGLKPSVSVKLLLGQVDRQIKRLVDSGEEESALHPDLGLFKNLLYYVAQADGASPSLAQIRIAYALDAALPDSRELEVARASMTAPNAALMQTVLSAVKEDLAGVKDGLDLFTRARGERPETLSPLVDNLHRVGDTLGMLGRGDLRKKVQEQVERLKGLMRSEEPPQESVFMEVASAILLVESSLGVCMTRPQARHDGATARGGEVSAGLVPEVGRDGGSGIVPEQAFRDVLAVALREAMTDMARTKDAIVTFINTPGSPESLSDVPALLTNVRGALRVLSMERAASLMNGVVEAIRREMLASSGPPSQERLDTLADAITSVEYFIEAATEHLPSHDAILDVAETSVAKLGAPLAEGRREATVVGSTTEGEPSPASLEQSSVSAQTAQSEAKVAGHEAAEDVSISEAFTPAGAEPEAGGAGGAITFEISSTSGEGQPAPERASADAGPSSIAGLAEPPADAIDDDVVDIFLEEAGEVLPTTERALGLWKAAPDDRESLAELRRAFHTLKGSGRMAGANTVGEFSWAAENLLNRVLEERVGSSSELFALIDEMVALLPDLMQRLEARSDYPEVVRVLIARAYALSEGKPFVGEPVLQGTVAEDGSVAPSLTQESAAQVVVPTAGSEEADLEFAEGHPILQIEEETDAGPEEPVKAKSGDETLPTWVGLEPPDKVAPDGAVEVVTPAEGAEEGADEELIELSGEVEEALSEEFLELSGEAEKEEPQEEVFDRSVEAVEEASEQISDLAGESERTPPEVLFERSGGIEESPPEQVLEPFGEADEARPEEEVPGPLAETEQTPSEELFEQSGEGEGVLSEQISGLAGESEQMQPSKLFEQNGEPVEPRLEPYELAVDGGEGPWQVAAGCPGAARESQSEKGVEQVCEVGEAPRQAIDIAGVMPRIDDTLLQIFRTEARTHLNAVQAFVDEHSGSTGPHPVTEALIRAVHTLHGSAHMAAIPVIAQLSGRLEHGLRSLVELGAGLDDEAVRTLSQVKDTLEELLGCINRPDAVLPDYSQLQEDIDSHVARAMELSPPAQGEGAPSCEVAVVGHGTGTGSVDERSNRASAEEERPGEQDEELLAIFLDEARDILDAMDDRLQACARETMAGDELADLRRFLHTLKGGARLVGVSGMAELSHVLESMFAVVTDGSCMAAEQHADIAQRTVDGLNSMLDQVAGGRAIPRPEHLITEIEELSRKTRAAREPSLAQPISPEVERSSAQGGYSGERTAGNLEQPDSSVVTSPPEAYAVDVATEEPDLEMVEVFQEEALDLIDAMEHGLTRWRNNLDDAETLSELQRSLHTLKGGARLVGVTKMGDLSHALESMFVAIVNGKVEVGDRHFDLAQQAVDRLSGMLDQVIQPSAVESQNEIISQIQAISVPPGTESARDVVTDSPESIVVARDEVISPVHPPVEQVSATPPSEPIADVQALPPERAVHVPTASMRETAEGSHRGEPTQASHTPQDQIRVRANLLDDLVNNSGEVSIYRARLEQQAVSFRFNISELDQTVTRLREQLRKLEIETEAQILFRYEKESDQLEEGFDPLEFDRFSLMQQLSRSLMESVNDLSNIQALLSDLNREAETLLLQQARVTNDLHEGLMRTRMVPFSNLVPRMRRLVRQTGQQLGKRVELEVSGAQGEMDRTILDRMVAPLEHLLRNAISHGIEAPAERSAAGKPKTGKITLVLSREGPDVLIEVADDGAGVDAGAVRRRALAMGLLRDDVRLNDNDLLQFILESGFSTAKEVTQISGRGVGMDVVNSEIKQLGGSLLIESQLGRGTNFTIRLPFTLAINQAILIQVGEETYAVPLSSVEGVVRASTEELQECYADPERAYEYAGGKYQVRHLATILGTAEMSLDDDVKWAAMLLVRTGDYRVALQVEGVSGNREIIVKPVGPQLSTVRWVSGATILADGRVVLILDMAAVARMRALHRRRGAEAELAEMPSAAEAQRPVVLVVDDSITVRKVTGRLLERNDMSVLTAKDGVEAVAVLEEIVPDVMLLDIEMPRMDGYELTRHIRGTDRLKDIPIIMITSRTGEKHRQRALGIGVNDYLGKPFQESDLLEHIHALVGSGDVP
jgi:chemosensory pili system protein ChpA (sensor histidine kinase/response regulator)